MHIHMYMYRLGMYIYMYMFGSELYLYGASVYNLMPGIQPATLEIGLGTRLVLC